MSILLHRTSENPCEYVACIWVCVVYGVFARHIFVSLFDSHPLSLKILPFCSLKQIGNTQFAPLHFFLPVASACLFPEGFSHLHSLLLRGSHVINNYSQAPVTFQHALPPRLHLTSEEKLLNQLHSLRGS